MKQACFVLFIICLVCASVMDHKTKTAYNFFWWIGYSLGIILHLWIRSMTPAQFVDLCIFILLQYKLFSRWYGKADCHAFCVCALFMAAMGEGLRELLWFMLLTFGLLGVVQLFRENIGSDGNLLIPVAFLPYISIAFLFFLWYHGI